jgi:uncharacterized protein involved in exopolysaccharide biosynthesis
MRLDLEAVGSLRTKRMAVGNRMGVASEWTLVDPLDVARTKLEARWANDDKVTAERLARVARDNAQRQTGQPKANGHTNGHTNGIAQVRQASMSELVHVTGTDAPRPMASLSPERYDEPRALVEAARQYAGLHRQVDTKIKELEALGITVDRDKLGKAVALPADPRLSAVAQAMPYIEALERQVERFSAQVADYKTKVGNLPELQSRLNRLHMQNERLVAEKVSLQAELSEARGAIREQRRPPTPVGPGAPAGK